MKNTQVHNNFVSSQLLRTAAISPNNIALDYCGVQLNYLQVAEGSQQVASQIIASGIEGQQCIGIFMQKCNEAILSIYSILMAGCIYVPLDVKNPPERIQYILDQCDISILLTTSDELEYLDSILIGHFADVKVIVIDGTQHEPINCLNDSNLQIEDSLVADEKPRTEKQRQIAFTLLKLGITDQLPDPFTELKELEPSALAAILFTSGSTGKPKGVIISHSTISTFIGWATEYFRLSSADTCISHAPINFDLSLFDIFASHWVGAKLVLIPDTMSGNPRLICQTIAQTKATIWQSVPSALVLMLKYGDLASADVSSIRHVLFAGEKMATQILSELIRHFKQADFHNVYGATETNDSFVYSIPRGTSDIPDPLPIGKPLPYVSYMIDSTNQNAKNGPSNTIKGQLLVNTATMMNGYKPKKNTTLIDQSKYQKKDYYYATGDIVEQQLDGNLIFCGRTDDIVKINGYRINLVEIQNVLLTHPDIIEAAVFAVQNEEESSQIIAFVFSKEEHHLSSIELKSFCVLKLARYAIPNQFFVCSTAMPKTTSGKIDKNKLYRRETSCQTVSA